MADVSGLKRIGLLYLNITLVIAVLAAATFIRHVSAHPDLQAGYQVTGTSISQADLAR